MSAITKPQKLIHKRLSEIIDRLMLKKKYHFDEIFDVLFERLGDRTRDHFDMIKSVYASKLSEVNDEHIRLMDSINILRAKKYDKSSIHLIRKKGELIKRSICTKTIRDLMTLDSQLLGDSAVLKNMWDDVCVQQQSQESIIWDLYDDQIETHISHYLDQLSKKDLQYAYLTSDDGEEYLTDAEELNYFNVNPDKEHLGKQIKSDYVFQEANNWSNNRIKEALENF